MAKSNKTSEAAASAAAKLLRNPKADKNAKNAAASALTHKSVGEKTTKKSGRAADKILRNPRAGKGATSSDRSTKVNVTLAYAKEHLEELLISMSAGVELAIAVPDVGTVHLSARASKAPVYAPRVAGQWSHLPTISEERLLAPLTDEELGWLSGEHSETP